MDFTWLHFVQHWNLLMRGIVQDLVVKPKYLLTFTVGYQLRTHIDISVKKVISDPFYVHIYLIDAGKCWVLNFYSSPPRTTLLCCFTMITEHLNGINMSGQSGLYTLVFRSKQNGNTLLMCWFFSSYQSIAIDNKLINIAISVYWPKVVCKTFFTPWHCRSIWLHIYLGWGPWDR